MSRLPLVYAILFARYVRSVGQFGIARCVERLNSVGVALRLRLRAVSEGRCIGLQFCNLTPRVPIFLELTHDSIAILVFCVVAP